MEEAYRRKVFDELPSCLPEDEAILSWIMKENLSSYQEQPSILVNKMKDHADHQALLARLIKGLNKDELVKPQLSSDQWTEIKEATCIYLQDGVDEAFSQLYVMIDGAKYKDGELAVVKREYKKELTLTAYRGSKEISEGLSWRIDNEDQTGSVVFDAGTVSSDTVGNVVTALLGNREVKVKIVVAEVILHRDITMAVSAHLYPTISPEGIADKIIFKSGNEEILRLSAGYPSLNLIAGKPGETTVSAKYGETIFHQRTIKVVKEPEVEFVKPVVSSVKFENVSVSSSNYNTVKLTEIDGVGLNGLCSPESIKIDKPKFFYLKGDRWYPYIERVEGEYFFDYRLVEGQQEVTGPGGNTTQSNYCEQLMVLKSIPKYVHGPEYKNYCNRQGAANQPIWYMLEAVKEHEKVHEPNVIDVFIGNAKDSILTLINNKLSFEDHPQKTFSEIENEAFIIIDFMIDDIEEKATDLWLNESLKKSANDHNSGGAAEQAEYAVINPMIEQICAHSKSAHWAICEPDICNEDISYGPEIPYIIDVTDPTNPVRYNLNDYVAISMGNRDQLTLRLSLENSMVIDKDVSWHYTFDGNKFSAVREIVFNKYQLHDTPEIINITYQDSHYEFHIKP